MSGRSDKFESVGPLWQLGHRTEISTGRLAELGIPVAPDAKEAPTGDAFSLEPSRGEPRYVSVLPDDADEPFWIDRRTMRVARSPRTSLMSEQDVVRVADLADRVQLALGEPVHIRFAFAANRAHVTRVSRVQARTSFMPTSYRCIAPFIGDKSTLAPLSIDALDRALRAEEDRGDEHRVRAIFGRAYRKVDAHHTPWARGSRGRLRAIERLTRLGRDVALAQTDARRYRLALAESIAGHESEELVRLDRQDLIEALRKRMGLVVSALVLLERSRMATLGLVPLLERACGALERDTFLALAAPVYPAERRAIDGRLSALAKSCSGPDGDIVKPSGGGALEEWERLARTLRHVRSLGMDVRPQAMGESDEHLLHALYEVRVRTADDARLDRELARNRITRAALRGPLGPAGWGLAGSVVPLLDRLSLAKGVVAEGLSAALLRLRSVALEAGRRLSEEGTLERADDTLYMTLEEIEQALEGELGAYAARARLRREDDRRWRNFDAPRLLHGRSQRSEP